MTATATMRRGTTGGLRKRKTAAKLPARRKPSMVARVMAAVPISARTVERIVTFSILASIGGTALAIMIMLGVPTKVGIAAGEAVGRAGFSVKHIEVTGVERMDRASIYAVALDQKSIAMPLVDLEKIRTALLKYGWIADARVSRRLPDTLAIEIVERKPAAVWQHDHQLTLVDEKGVVLDAVALDAMPDLPLVIGPDANVQATALTDLMKHAPQLKPMLDGAVWVGDRRWNLRFQSGEMLMLPEGEVNAAAALREFARLDAERRLLGRGLARFDMRDPTQVIVLPGTPAQQADKPVDPADTSVNI